MVSAEPEHKLTVAAVRWGTVVGRHYKRIVAITTLVALLCAAGAAVTFQMDDGDAAAMFTPVGNAGSADRDRLHAKFPNFDITPTSVIITRRAGGSMVTTPAFNASVQLHQRLMAVHAAVPEGVERPASGADTVSFQDICLALPTGDCLINSVLRCYAYTATSPIVLTDPACLDALGVPVFTRTSIGGDVESVPLPGVPGVSIVQSAQALRYDYLANAQTPEQVALAMVWEREAVKVLEAYAAEVDGEYSVTYMTVAGMTDEGAALAGGDFILFAVSGMVMVLVMVGFTASAKEPIHSRGMVAYAGVMPVYFAMFASLAALGPAGVKFNSLMALTPILFLANALECVFILNRSFTRTHARFSVELRMAQAMGAAAPTVLGTQVVQTLVFTIATLLSPFPAVTALCTFVAATTPAHVLFQLTWYAAMLAWDGKREADGRHAFMPCYRPGRRTTRAVHPAGALGTTSIVPVAAAAQASDFRTPAPPSSPPQGDSEVTFVRPMSHSGSSEDADLETGRGVTVASRNDDVPTVTVDQALRLSTPRTHINSCYGVLEGKYGEMIMSAPGRGLVMTCFQGLMVFAVIGVMGMQIGLAPEEGFAPTSRIGAFFTDQAKYFAEIGLPAHLVVDGEVAYWDTEVASALQHLTAGLADSKATVAFPPVDSWFAAYLAYLDASSIIVPTDEMGFISNLFGFLMQPQYMRYRADLTLAKPDGTLYPLTATDFTDGVKLVASRITLTLVPAYSGTEQSQLLNDLRDSVLALGSEALPEVYVTGQSFPLYEQQEAVLPFIAKVFVATVFTAATVAGAVLPKPLLACLVQVTVLVTLGAVLGMLTPVAGLALNVVTMVELLFVAGVAPSFAMHIARAFGGDDMQSGRLSSMIATSRQKEEREAEMEALRKREAAARAAVPTSIVAFFQSFLGGTERRQRALFGLSAMGHPMLNTGLSVGVGLVCLSFASSYALRSLARVMLLALPVGLLHTMAVLPVMVALLGPKAGSFGPGPRPKRPLGSTTSQVPSRVVVVK